MNTFTTGIQDDPLVAMAADGGFVVVWEGNPELNARRYDASGNPVGAEFLVNSYTTGTQFVYGMAMDRAGELHRRVGGAGQPRRKLQRRVRPAVHTGPTPSAGRSSCANTYTTGAQGWPAPAADEVSGTTWSCGRAATTPLRPASSGSDSAASTPNALGGGYARGTGVLEPGEATVVPAWRNHRFVASTITGTASAFTGPPPGVYTIADATAAYGAVAAGAVADCLATGTVTG